MQLNTLIKTMPLLIGMSMSYSYMHNANAAPSVSMEQQSIRNLLDEDKLARDLYLSLGQKWNLMPFQNIPNSEQMHMDSLKQLIQNYTKQNPIANNKVGKFTNPEVQKLYNQLLAYGLQSPQQALQVGGWVEETDIADLKKAAAETQDPQSLAVYDDLLRGSRNHLRAFARQLGMFGIEYKAQVLPESDVQAILNSPQEPGNHAGQQGTGAGMGRGMGGGMGMGRGMGGMGFGRGQWQN